MLGREEQQYKMLFMSRWGDFKISNIANGDYLFRDMDRLMNRYFRTLSFLFLLMCTITQPWKQRNYIFFSLLPSNQVFHSYLSNQLLLSHFRKSDILSIAAMWSFPICRPFSNWYWQMKPTGSHCDFLVLEKKIRLLAAVVANLSQSLVKSKISRWNLKVLHWKLSLDRLIFFRNLLHLTYLW